MSIEQSINQISPNEFSFTNKVGEPIIATIATDQATYRKYGGDSVYTQGSVIVYMKDSNGVAGFITARQDEQSQGVWLNKKVEDRQMGNGLSKIGFAILAKSLVERGVEYVMGRIWRYEERQFGQENPYYGPSLGSRLGAVNINGLYFAHEVIDYPELTEIKTCLTSTSEFPNISRISSN